MKNFWEKLPQPFFALAPMDDVTDTVFRQIVARCFKPDVFFTEFVNCEGLCSVGLEKVATRLKFSEKERPLVAQIWGTKPENFFKTAQIIAQKGFDGIDINMGCPDRSVLRHGGGGALIENPNLVREIIIATKEGAPGLPLSIKTRIGFKKIMTEDWLRFLLGLKLDALTIHGRTVAELSKVPAHWEEIGKAVQIRNFLKSKTKIIGNGDIKSYQEGLEKSRIYKVDGVMVGRGIFDNLWIFQPGNFSEKISPERKIEILLQHVRLFNETWGQTKNFDILKKFFKIYINGFVGASKLRSQLMETNNVAEVEKIVSQTGKDDKR